MFECNHVPTQRANIVLLIRWRMHENRGVVRQNNRESRGERVRDEKKKISANPRSWYEVFSPQLAADVWSMRLEEQSPPLRAPPPQAPLH